MGIPSRCTETTASHLFWRHVEDWRSCSQLTTRPHFTSLLVKAGSVDGIVEGASVSTWNIQAQAQISSPSPYPIQSTHKYRWRLGVIPFRPLRPLPLDRCKQDQLLLRSLAPCLSSAGLNFGSWWKPEVGKPFSLYYLSYPFATPRFLLHPWSAGCVLELPMPPLRIPSNSIAENCLSCLTSCLHWDSNPYPLLLQSQCLTNWAIQTSFVLSFWMVALLFVFSVQQLMAWSTPTLSIIRCCCLQPVF